MVSPTVVSAIADSPAVCWRLRLLLLRVPAVTFAARSWWFSSVSSAILDIASANCFVNCFVVSSSCSVRRPVTWLQLHVLPAPCSVLQPPGCDRSSTARVCAAIISLTAASDGALNSTSTSANSAARCWRSKQLANRSLCSSAV